MLSWVAYRRGLGGENGSNLSGGRMVELKPIDESNFVGAFNLTLAPGQERFVSHPVRSPTFAR